MTSRQTASRSGDDDDAMQRATPSTDARYSCTPGIGCRWVRKRASVRRMKSAAASAASGRPVITPIDSRTSTSRLPMNVRSESSTVIGTPSSVTNSASTALASTSLSAITPSKSNTIRRGYICHSAETSIYYAADFERDRIVRVLQISDTHLSPGKRHFEANWAPLRDWIAQQKPDVIDSHRRPHGRRRRRR